MTKLYKIRLKVFIVAIVILFFTQNVSSQGIPDNSNVSEEPGLPMGLGNDTKPEVRKTTDRDAPQLPFDLSGFWETRLGARTQEDSHEKDMSIAETRLRLQLEKAVERATFMLTTDLLFDPVLDRYDIRLEEGEGAIDLREASLLFSPTGFMDVKAGRQTLTWGTGDLIFINDLFSKDWNSFFIGRNQEYLKAPSDAMKISFFSDLANLDIIYLPRFDADRFIDGKRISFFNSQLGRRSGRDAIAKTNKRDQWFDDDEITWRLYKNVGGYELAVYGYRGFWKSPAGMDSASGNSTFPVLSAYGGSVRGIVGKGIGNLETGYYNSENDKSGNDSSVRNSEFRFLTGYEQEAAKNFTVGIQYYLEHIMHYDNYRNSLPSGSPAADEDRHLLTMRLTKLLLDQNLTISLFTFYSPSDNDAYLRPKISYKIDDHWMAESGGNLFTGKEDYTFFGQFEKNSNIYVGARYGF